MILRRILPFCISLLLMLLIPVMAPACAPAPPQGMTVQIPEESAVIVWDRVHHVQHFIRRASFRSDAPDFGFLVPTPARPELAEATGQPEPVIAEITRPKVVEKEEHGIRPMLLIADMFFATRGYETAATMPAVRVLSSQRVAGYDAVVLEADDAHALNTWLGDHGYPASPALQEWLEPYVSMKWIITAFKIAGDPDTGATASGLVRMSFSADRPFFPYREPRMEEAPGSRILQVFVLSDARVEGKLGPDATAAWPGRLQYADRLAPSDQSRLLKELGLDANGLQEGMWLNAFEDPSSPRPGTADLFFERSADQSSLTPPPYVVTRDRRIPVPLDLLLLAGVIVAFFVWRSRS